MTSGGLAAVSSSFFAALYSAFGKYDVVHIHAEGPAFFCWLPKLFGKRVVVTIHGLDWAREKWRGSVASKFIRGGEKNAVKYADEIIVLSKGVQKYFMETYGRETHFIPNGVNRPEIREAKLITDKFGLKKDSYILFLGRLVPEKGIRYLVEAFKNVKTDKKLVIAGGSSDTDSFMEELKELAKGDDRILFTGFVQGAMLDELYSNAYIYTSRKSRSVTDEFQRCKSKLNNPRRKNPLKALCREPCAQRQSRLKIFCTERGSRQVWCRPLSKMSLCMMEGASWYGSNMSGAYRIL